MSIYLILLVWVFYVGFARKALTTIAHQCIHHHYTGNKKADKIITEVLTTILLLQPFDQYRIDHSLFHHGNPTFATDKDPDVAFLLLLGFHPGMNKNNSWVCLWKTLFSPKFHWLFLKGRLKSNFILAPRYRILMSCVWFSYIALTTLYYSAWVELLVAFIIPLIFLYQIAALLQFLSEHAWLVKKDPEKKSSAAHKDFSWARFCGSLPPTSDLKWFRKYFSWLVWFLKMIFIHLPIRIAVLPGDLVVHDYHHHHPGSKHWNTAIFSRRKDIEGGEIYNEHWGLTSAINTVFEGLEN